MTRYAVRAFGEDRPGIVAALTWALAEAGGNLEHVSATSLSGHFVMMLVVDASELRESLQARVSESLEPLGVSVTVLDANAGSPDHTHATHTLALYGPDRPGIVAGVSRVLADRAVNITDLLCRTVEEDGEPIYSMVAELALPSGGNVASLRAQLRATAKDLGLEMSLESIDQKGVRRDRSTGARSGRAG